ncbi:MAG: helix-turn-helix domain-containing protein [Oligoflexus sp.]
MQALEIMAPSPEERKKAEQALQALVPLLKVLNKDSSLSLTFTNDGKQRNVGIPMAAFVMFEEILRCMSEGQAITLIPQNKYFTTQEAADFLNVSRPYVVKLLEKGEIPFVKIGKHRRVKATDLFDYAKKQNLQTEQSLEELAKTAQDLDMGY